MLSLAFIRDNPDAVRTAIAQKNVALDLDALLALDGEVRGLKTRVDGLRAERNAISDGFKSAAPEERPALGAKAKAIGAEIGEVEGALSSNVTINNVSISDHDGVCPLTRRSPFRRTGGKDQGR